MADNKVAIIMGGGSGMGADSARRLAADGFNVAILSSSGKGEALAKELSGIGVTGTNKSSDDMQKLVDAAMGKWGRVDVLVNSAGHGPRAPVLEISDEDWHEGMEVYFLNSVRATRIVAPIMLAQKSGTIINISTFAAFEPDAVFPTSGVMRAGLAAYTKPKVKTKPLVKVEAATGEGTPVDPIDRTAKMYVGGKQARPDSGYSKPIWGKSGLLGHVGLANRKDIRNAVEAAAGAKGWSKTTGHLRAQILYYIGENLSARADEFAARIDAMTGKKDGAKEVEASIQRLFTAAAWADKYDGQVHGVPIRGVAIAMKEPVGVIGALCADEAPLLGLVSAMAPTIAMGNRVVLAASEPYPLAATDFYQILETSDVPAGVVNILTGSHAELAKPLASHLNVDAVWSFSSTDLSKEMEVVSAGNLKRTWVNNATAFDWSMDHSRRFLQAATEIKNIWVPYGE